MSLAVDKIRGDAPITSDADRRMRKSRLALDRWHNGLMKDTLGKYRKAVVQELGDEKSGTCYACNRPFRTDRAFRAVEKALDRKLGPPQIAVQINTFVQQQLGCQSEQEARERIQLSRDAETVDDQGMLTMALEIARNHGYTCLPPEAAANGRGGVPGDGIIAGDAGMAPGYAASPLTTEGANGSTP